MTPEVNSILKILSTHNLYVNVHRIIYLQCPKDGNNSHVRQRMNKCSISTTCGILLYHKKGTAYWSMLQHAKWNIQSQRPCTWFHLCEIPRVDKPMKIINILVAVWESEWEWLMGMWILSRLLKMFWKNMFSYNSHATLWLSNQNHWIVHFMVLNSVMYELYLYLDKRM